MTPRRRLLTLGYWLAVFVLATLSAKGAYDTAMGPPVCFEPPCPAPGTSEWTAWAASVRGQAPGAAGRDFMIVVLLAVVVHGLGKLAVWLIRRRRPRP